VDSPEPHSPPPEGTKSGSTFALLLALLLPMGLLAQATSVIPGLIWTELFVFLLPAVVATVGSNLEPSAWLRLRPPPVAALALAPVAGFAAWLLGSALFAAVRAIAPATLVLRFDLSRLFEGSTSERAAFAIAAVIVAPLCEEVAFRGHLARAFHSRHRPAFAIGASAAVFALLHLDPIRAPALLALGSVYGWLAYRSGSIWPAVLAHATNNGIAAACAFAAPERAELEEPTLGMALLGVGIGLIATAGAVALFRFAVARAPPPGPTPPLDPLDPSMRFRLSRVPPQLVPVLAAGLVSLGAILYAVR
jgi:membrane protease YdiL (CAAX protease family)